MKHTPGTFPHYTQDQFANTPNQKLAVLQSKNMKYSLLPTRFQPKGNMPLNDPPT